MAEESIVKVVDWRVDMSRSLEHEKVFDLDVFGHVLQLSANFEYMTIGPKPSFDFDFGTDWKDPEVAGEHWMRQFKTVSCSGEVTVSRNLNHRRCLLRYIWTLDETLLRDSGHFIKTRKLADKKVYFIRFKISFAIVGASKVLGDIGSTSSAAVVAPPRGVRIASPFLNDPTFSDVVVVCRDETFHCHKVILAGASDVFKTMLTGNFREAHENRIDISCFELDTVANLIRFIYEDDVPEEAISWELYEAAKMYEVHGLEKACLFRLRMSLDVANCCRMLEAASAHGLHGLFRLAANFLSENKEEVMKTAGWKRLRKINKQLASRLNRLKPFQRADEPK